MILIRMIEITLIRIITRRTKTTKQNKTNKQETTMTTAAAVTTTKQSLQCTLPWFLCPSEHTHKYSHENMIHSKFMHAHTHPHNRKHLAKLTFLIEQIGQA